MRPHKFLKHSRELLSSVSSPFELVTDIYFDETDEGFDAWKSTQVAKYEDKPNTIVVLIDLTEGN